MMKSVIHEVMKLVVRMKLCTNGNEQLGNVGIIGCERNCRIIGHFNICKATFLAYTYK